jgi:hypothetical protein
MPFLPVAIRVFLPALGEDSGTLHADSSPDDFPEQFRGLRVEEMFPGDSHGR